VAEIGYLRRVHSVTLRDKVRSCPICKNMIIAALLRIMRSKQWWLGHVFSMSQETSAKHVFVTAPMRNWPRV